MNLLYRGPLSQSRLNSTHGCMDTCWPLRESNCVYCVISHKGHWTDGSELQRDKKGGREGQNEIQKVCKRQREGETDQSRQWGSVMWEKILESEWKVVPFCPAVGKVSADSQIQGEAVFIVFKVFAIMWIIPEDRVRLYSWWDLRQRGGDRKRKIEYLLAAAS